MAKTSPEKLAAALRANLKRRKQPPGSNAQGGGQAAQNAGPAPPAKGASKPPKNSA